MTTAELMSLMADAVQIGFMQAVKSYEPTNDTLRLSEVKKWLKQMYIPYEKFDKLCKAGLITTFRKGDAKNSPLYYSKAEIKKALTTAKLAALTR